MAGRGVGRLQGPNAEQDKKTWLRTRLLDMGSSFVEFDRRVGEDARKRREIEAHRFRELLSMLSALEASVRAEAHQREEAAKQLQGVVGKLLDGMVSRIQGAVLDRFTKLSRAVQQLCERCQTLERGLQQFRGEVPSRLRLENAELRQAIRKLATELQVERRRREGEESLLFRTIEEAERSLEARLQQEVLQLERQREALQDLIDDFASSGDREEAVRRRAIATDAVGSLQAELNEEASTREQADDQVVQAINEYTNLLHRSLRMTTA